MNYSESALIKFNSIQELNNQFVQTLTLFQYQLLQKSRIWTLSKESYLDVSKVNEIKGLSLQQRYRYIQGIPITPENLLIVEKSPHYDQNLLERENEEDKVKF